jgi:hypothetical protein
MPENTCSIFVQPLKAELPIEVTELPMVTEVRPMQEEKALLPIVFTELGIVTEERPLQPLKA